MSVRVLIADPDQRLLARYRDFLSHHGFEVTTVADGLACLARLRSSPPDVLVLEADLPWGQGEGILALMEEEPDVPKVPVIVLSAGTGPPGRGRALPGVAHFVKPLGAWELAECIRRLRADAGGRGAAAGSFRRTAAEGTHDGTERTTRVEL